MESQTFEAKETVRLESSGAAAEVEELLGSGGQGEVYRVRVGTDHLALKWFFPAMATPEQRAAIELLVRKGAPNEHFLWPIEVATAPGKQGFGYLMRLREPRFKGILDLVKRRAEPTFRALATAGLNLAHNYLQLHSEGLCYRDISFGNAFFDPVTGDVLIADNDNVAVDGAATIGVLGTPRFMAPEVVRGEAMPSTQTDLYSLAVLLFYMLMVHHPLEGRRELEIKCLDLPAMTKLYGTHALFIFDPDDRSNEPVPGYHDNALAFWPIYPESLRALFTRSFTAGIRDPRHGRVRESEWRLAMAELRDAIVYCPHCGLENIYDPADLRLTGALGPCWSCARGVPLPPRLRFGKSVVVLNHDTRIFPHHVDPQRLYDFSAPVGEVQEHPSKPGVWGLKNVSGRKWVSTTPDGRARDVEPGRTAAIVSGTKIHFGSAEGEVRA
jgi:DNA-binding helix-hairpin-helix protein with protein kinase domain